MQGPLILWGGTDIDPHWYFETPLPTTQHPDRSRDNTEWLSILKARDKKKPIIGICRGAQLLCAFNGGKLHQHKPEHCGPLSHHSIVIYDLEGKKKQIIDDVSANHHQVMIPSKEGIILGQCSFDAAPEIVYWPETRSLGIQAHPEWMNKNHPFNQYLQNLCYDLFEIKDIFDYFHIKDN